jgi:hypothetical protein
MGITFLNSIPEFSSDYIILKSGKALAGSVVIRPLDILGGTTLEYHYGIVLGTSTDGRELIIEMTKGRDVNIVTKEIFLEGFELHHLEVYGVPKEITRNEILKRAQKYQFDSYSLTKLNCKDFALYCAYLIEPKNRTEDLVRGAIFSNEFSIEYWRILSSQGDSNHQMFAQRMLAEMDQNKLQLETKLKAIVDDHSK